MADKGTTPTIQPTPTQNEFLTLLVQAVTGVDPSELELERRKEVESKVIALFSDFIVAYVGEKYGEKDATRLKAARQTGEDVFTKFADLGPKFDEAYQAFLDNLEKIWKEKMSRDTENTQK